jgi:hypothetical protein
MTTETKLKAGLVVTLLTLIIVQFFYFENVRKFDEYKDSSIKQIDSLNDELFNEQSDAGRHELTRDEIFHKYPKIGKEYEKYYQHETE